MESIQVTNTSRWNKELWNYTFRESHVIEKKTGWSAEEVLAKVGIQVTTLGKDGVLAGMKKGAAFFDLSTNSPTVVRRMHAKFAQQGINMFDSPVSGGPVGAKSGKLALLVGGDQIVGVALGARREGFDATGGLLAIAARNGENLAYQVTVDDPKVLTAPWTEAPRGALGVHAVSDGGTRPFRVHVRDPSFNNLQATAAMCEGGQVADVIAAVASIDPVMGGVDR